jgi:hypothetical protein
MDRAIQQFEVNIQSASQLGIIYAAFEHKVTAVIKLEEVLRAELVLAVSAVDCYIHDIVRIGMTNVFAAAGGESNAFINFSVSLGFAKRIAAAPLLDRAALVEEEIRRFHGYKTFQNADSISQALAFIGVQAIWDKVGMLLALSPTDVRRRLDIIVDRRNRIAHESDIDPTMGIGTKYPIDYPMIEQAVSFLDRIVRAIHATVIDMNAAEPANHGTACRRP